MWIRERSKTFFYQGESGIHASHWSLELGNVNKRQSMENMKHYWIRNVSKEKQECVECNFNPEGNVGGDDYTNENPRKKTFSRDTTKEG